MAEPSLGEVAAAWAQPRKLVGRRPRLDCRVAFTKQSENRAKNPNSGSPIFSERAIPRAAGTDETPGASYARIYEQREVLSAGGARHIFMPVSPEQGRLLYLVARTLGARHIVEFGTSFGISTIYLAAALRDNGGGPRCAWAMRWRRCATCPSPSTWCCSTAGRSCTCPCCSSGKNGFQSVTLSIADGFEYSYYEGASA